MNREQGERRGPWRVLETALKYETPWIRVEEHAILNPAGRPGIYGTVHMKAHAFGIIPVLPDGRIVIVGQHRFPLDAYSWEIIEGGGNAAEPENSARRELAEETGLIARRLHPLLNADISNSVTDERASVYVAWDLEEGAPAPDETEILSLRRLGFGELLQFAAKGGITDVLSLAALFKLKHLYDEGSLPGDLAALLAQTI